MFDFRLIKVLCCAFRLGLPMLCVLVAASTWAQAPDRLLRSRFDALDKDSDGFISATEAPFPVLMRRFDSDRDGKLTITEFQAVMERSVAGRSLGASKDATETWKPAKFLAEIPADAPFNRESILAAAKFSADMRGISFLVMYDGELIYEDYPNGGAVDRAYELASGTKSFTGVMAAAAIADGLIDSFDEVVSDTIDEWQGDPKKKSITVRQLLNLTGGIDPKGDGPGRVSSYGASIQNDCISQPGTKFNYGPAPFQCFGELMKRKLIASGSKEDVLDYMVRRIFKPIDLDFQFWRRGSDRNPNLPSGAHLTARDWAKFGELVRTAGVVDGKPLVPAALLDECFVGTEANPAYGLTFWLNEPVSLQQRRSIPQLRFGTDDLSRLGPTIEDLVFAAGAGKQRMMVSRNAKLVVVRQAEGIMDELNGRRSSAYSDAEFLQKLLK